MIDMIAATLYQPRWSECMQSWFRTATHSLDRHVIPGQRILNAYQQGAFHSSNCILGFVHDDLIIHEQGWDERVIEEFRSSIGVGIVGFAGALGHGHPDLYKGDFHIPNMARQRFLSNLRNAERHGSRFTGACDVAVLDGLALFVSRQFLDVIGGWPQDGSVSYFMYSEWLCCMARRHGRRIRLVGVDCEHLGGMSTGLKPDQEFNFETEHRFIYENFKDVLPFEVKQ